MSTNTLPMTEVKVYLRLLQRHFRTLSEPNLLKEVLDVGDLVTIPKGKVIMNYGNYIRSIPLVLDGVIKVSRENEDGQALLLNYLQPGDTCSITLNCCRVNKKSILKTVAETEVTMLKIPVSYMDSWMTKYPSWKNFIMLSYDKYSSQLVTSLDAVAFQKVDERLANYLEAKANILNTRQLEISHAAIAIDLNASRETISRLLKQMERESYLKLGRNKIELMQ